MFIYLLLVVVLGLLLLHFYIRYSRCGILLNRLPGPSGLPIFGNALEVNLPPAELYKKIRVWTKQYYPIFRMWVVNIGLVHIRHPDDFEILFTSKDHIEKKYGYEQMAGWLNTGLLTSGGQKWSHRRKILTPAFHFNILKRHMEMICEEAEKTVSKMRNKKQAKFDVDLLPFCMRYTLSVICESSMGVVVDDESEKTMRYKQGLEDMTHMIIYRMIRPYIQDWSLPLFPSANKRIKNSINETNSFINEIIQQRRQYHKETAYKHLEQFQNNVETMADDVHLDGKKKRLAMLDLLLAAERDNLIDHEGIREEVATFVFEGHDTTGMALLFCIMELAENEDVQRRARQEAEEIMNRKNGKLDFSDLKDMVYLERCIKESLRLYPSVPSIIRYAAKDLQLKHCLVPKGSNIIMHIVDAHRDPNFWPEPEKFDPDRFLPQEVSKRHPFAYVPFSAGSRNCIGQKMAMMEMKVFLSVILCNFYLEPIDRSCDIEMISDIILRPDRAVHTTFIKIDR